MNNADDFAAIWQGTGSAVEAPIDVDALVGTAGRQRARRWWPVVFATFGLLLAVLLQINAYAWWSFGASGWMNAIGASVIACAFVGVVVAALAQRFTSAVLSMSVAFDDVIEQGFRPLSRSVRVVAIVNVVALVVAAHLLIFAIAASFPGEAIHFIPLAIVSTLITAALAIDAWLLERLLRSLSTILPSPSPPPSPSPSLPPPSSLLSLPSPAALAVRVPRRTTPPLPPVVLGAGPGSSAMIPAHFDDAAQELVSSRERRQWKTVVALTALGVVPIIIDALAVLALQWGPQPEQHTLGHFSIPLLHLVLPYLPIAVTLLASLLTPPAFFAARDVVDSRFAGRFTWLLLLVLLAVPAVFGTTGLALPDAENAHLWGYSLSRESVVNGLDPLHLERLPFFIRTCLSAGARALHFVAVVVIAVGVWRVLGHSKVRFAIAFVLVLQLLVWFAAAFVAGPATWRAVIDVMAPVALLLAAVFSQRTIDR